MKVKIKSAKWLFPVFFSLTLVCALIMSIYVCSQKNQWYIDEVWTYGLSNSYDKIFLYDIFQHGPNELEEINAENGIENFTNRWQDGSVFRDYITVQKGEEFSYDNVFRNQSNDVHPPLYYSIIHTICSFFSDTYSKWYVFAPNISFYMISMILLFAVAYKLTQSKLKSLFIMIFWGFSQAAVSNYTFCRMYMLLTVFVLSFILIHITVLEKEEFAFRNIIPLFLVCIAGFLTQYYFYIYAFFGAAFTCLVFLGKKKWKSLFTYAGTVLISVGTAFAVFPSIFTHISSSPRSVSSLTSVFRLKMTMSTLTRYNRNIFSKCFNIELPSMDYFINLFLFFILPLVVLIIVVMLWLISLIKKRDIFENVKNKSSLLFILISVFATYVVMAAISPIGSSFEDRYLYVFYPVICMLIAFLLFALCERIAVKIKKIPAMVFSAIVICFFSILGISNYVSTDVLKDGEMTTSDLGSLISGKNCVVVPAYDYIIHVNVPELIEAEQVYIASDLNSAVYAINEASEKDTVFCVLASTAENVELGNLDSEYEYKGRVQWGDHGDDAKFDIYYVKTGM